MGEINLENLKTEFPDKWKNITEKLNYPDEYFISIDDYQKPVEKLKIEAFFSKLKKDCPEGEEIERKKLLNCFL